MQIFARRYIAADEHFMSKNLDDITPSAFNSEYIVYEKNPKECNHLE